MSGYAPNAPISANDAKVIGVAINSYAGVLVGRAKIDVTNLVIEGYDTPTIDAAVARERAYLLDVQRVVNQFTVEPFNYPAMFDSVVEEALTAEDA